MTRTTNRATIRSRIRIACKRPSSVYPTDAELNYMIDESWCELWELMVAEEPFRYVKQGDISVTSGSRSFTLPSDFKECVGVAIRDTNKIDGYTVLERYNWDERYDYQYSQEKRFARYNIQYGKMWIHPTPNWSDTIRIEYIPYAEEWDDGTTIDTVNGWDKWIVYDVCGKLKGMDEEDVSFFLLEKQKIEARIISSAKLDVGEPPCMVDHRRGNKKFPSVV